MSWLQPAVALCVATLLAGCVQHTVKSTSVPAIDTPTKTVAEHLLLDVAIPIFDPGLDNYQEGEQVYPEVRKAEARFMPAVLAEAMQNSGAWGAVRVVPKADRATDLTVEGKILHSDGETLELQISAIDSRGSRWLDKSYKGRTSQYAYRSTTRQKYDPFQAVYNTIANDLQALQTKLRDRERRDIRNVTELLFARSLSPDAFADHLRADKQDRYKILRLPAEDDPMLARIRMLRQRDYQFIDTMQVNYQQFMDEMISPYQEWRKLTYEEVVAMRELRAESTRRLIAGGLSVVAGLLGATSDDGAARVGGQVAILGGGYLLKSGLEKRHEAQIHVEALEELGMSLESDITPQVIELEDRTVLLSGSVEDQFAQWREVLADIYRAEIGELVAPTDAAGETGSVPTDSGAESAAPAATL